MESVYNKKHVQASVAAATILGMAFGFWLGKRMAVAGIVESALVWIGYIVLSSIVFSRIDKQYLPEVKPED